MKLHGKYNFYSLTIFILAISITQCAYSPANRMAKYNRVEYHQFDNFYTHFKNDSLKFEIGLFDKWNIIHSKNGEIEKAYLKQAAFFLNVKENYLNMKLIACFNDNSINPKYHSVVVTLDISVLNMGFEKNQIYFKDFLTIKTKIKNSNFYVFEFKDSNKKEKLYWINWTNTSDSTLDKFHNEINYLAYRTNFGINYNEIYVPNPIVILDSTFNYQRVEGGNYLKPIVELEKIKLLFKTEYDIEIWKDIYNIAASRVGLKEEERTEIGPSSEKIDYILKNGEYYEGSNGLKYLLERCSKNQVVMFNEAHHRPNNRYLESELLDSLYKLGFKTLALESIIHESAQNLMMPNLKLGWFQSEPQESNLIRTAKQIGYKIVSYEDSTFSEFRESIEANNLIKKTIKNDKNEKIIVLCGYAHIFKDTSVNKQKMMALEFKELTGINPLTINQTTLSNFKNLKAELIVLDGKQISKFYGGISDNDIYLMNNIPIEKLKIKPQEKDFTLNLKLDLKKSKSKENRFVCLVYFENEYNNFYRVPIFTKIVKKKEELMLKLPIGKYVIEVKDVDGQTLFKESHSIKGDN